jgi:cysteine desulfurase/selenocysteine lyase
MLDRFRPEFLVTEQYAYMDHAAAGPPSIRVARAVNDFLLTRSRLGSLYTDDSAAMTERVRGKAAALIGASPDELAYTKNTPDGLNIVANGLDWNPGDNIVTTDIEFPANIYPWLNLRPRGVDLRFVPSRDGCLASSDVIAAIDNRTRLVALSWVQFHGGFRNDLATIGGACRERNVYLVVDAIQGIGVIRCDVKRLNIDFLATSCQKWLLAPHAVGLFYCRRAVMDHLEVTVVGQGSVQLGPRYLDYKLELKGDAARFEPGFGNQVGFAGLEAAIDLLNEAGLDKVEARILSLTARLRDALDSLGCHVLGSSIDTERAGIVAFAHPSVPAADIVKRLRDARVIVSERERYVRVSPHFYNTEAEIDQLIDVVRGLRT